MKQKKSFMEKVATFIVDKRIIIIILFAVMAIFCAVSRNWVQVNESITDYLSEDTETRQGLDLMNKEFVTYATADIMVENITYDQASNICEAIEGVEGVKSVAFDDTESHYKDASALFTVTFDGTDDDEISINALDAIKGEFSEYDIYVNSEVGNPLETIINQEMLLVDLIAVVIIVLVLLFTSKTYGEIPVLLLTFGAAALLNMGTNFLMGEISYVTNSIAIVLQLALAIDYAIILCHRYMEEHETKPPREAAIVALSKAIPEISASSLTTISGLLALTFMQFKLGGDIGSVLIKAILLSLVSVFLLMPGLLVIFSKWIDNSHHKSFVPKISFLGRFAYATRYIMPIIFVGVVIAAYFFSSHVNYVYNQYSVDSIRHNDNQIADQTIRDTFGETNTMALIVPSGDYESEAKIIEEVEELPAVETVTGLANVEAGDGYYITSSLTPRQFAEFTNLDYEVATILYTAYAYENDDAAQAIANLDSYTVPLIDMFTYLSDEQETLQLDLDEDTQKTLDDLTEQLNDAKLQLMSTDWSRIVVTLNLDTESEESFEYLNVIHGILARFYHTYYVVGDTTSCSDLKTSFEHDNLVISILTVAFVVLVLFFTFKSAGLPILLIVIIQGSIWVNFSIPYLKGQGVFFLTYLIISSIQMGANIDYAIVISSRYMELKENMSLKEAMIETLNLAFPTIITSGTILASAGVVIGFLTSNETISAIGVYLGEGTFISIFLVMCVLPQILLFGDSIIEKTTFDVGKKGVQRTGIVRLNGRVRGSMNGFIDAEVHGVFRGDLNAIIDVGDISDIGDVFDSGTSSKHKMENETDDSVVDEMGAENW